MEKCGLNKFCITCLSMLCIGCSASGNYVFTGPLVNAAVYTQHEDYGEGLGYEIFHLVNHKYTFLSLSGVSSYKATIIKYPGVYDVSAESESYLIANSFLGLRAYFGHGAALYICDQGAFGLSYQLIAGLMHSAALREGILLKADYVHSHSFGVDSYKTITEFDSMLRLSIGWYFGLYNEYKEGQSF